MSSTLHTLHDYILKAREQNIEQEVQADFSKKIISQGGQIAAEKLEILQNPLKCPLDMSNWDSEHYEEGLEVLLDKSQMEVVASSSGIQAKEKAQVNAFDNPMNKGGAKLDKIFLSPFQR